ncbi:hypothetical protein G7Z17_g2786 [Cylindrodendrum hubeiense]|uniref:CFEM domain-containing protein n=1 Tax=Cylindrodendrum hubeiense TaxID=595255 RepID=A0A9P5HMH7_9HYPO|nr:hypothetical protein G7Z17_g2786 [Cylindrodendrum hubeiense]
MKPSVLILATLTTSFAAAEVMKEDYFPECSIECLNDGTEKATDCSTTDAVCWCVQSNYEAIYNQAVNCVMEECGADKAIESVLPAAIEFCSAASSSTSALGSTETGKHSASSSSSSNSSSSNEAEKTTTSATVVITSGPSSSPTPSSSASASGSGSGAAASTTASTDAAVAVSPMGALGMLVLGVAAAL